jgi:hypothetical protein
MNPLHLAAPDGIGDMVQRVDRHSSAMLDAGRSQDDTGDAVGHFSPPGNLAEYI